MIYSPYLSHSYVQMAWQQSINYIFPFLFFFFFFLQYTICSWSSPQSFTNVFHFQYELEAYIIYFNKNIRLQVWENCWPFVNPHTWLLHLVPNQTNLYHTVRGFFSKFLMGGGTQNFRFPLVPNGDEVGWEGTCKINPTEAKTANLM